MPIAIRCPMCSKAYHLSNEQAGRRVRCRECKCEFDVAALPEQLEVVEKPRSRRGLPDQDAPVVPQVVRDEPKNRSLLYVLIGVGSVLMVSFLGCAGLIWLVTTRVPPAVQQVVREVQPPPPPPAAPAPPPVARPAEAPVQMPNIRNLLGEPVKDFNDALARLRSAKSGDRVLGLEWLGKQKPPDDPALKKKVLDAVEPLTRDDDPLVQAAAGLVQINWGGFDP